MIALKSKQLLICLFCLGLLCSPVYGQPTDPDPTSDTEQEFFEPETVEPIEPGYATEEEPEQPVETPDVQEHLPVPEVQKPKPPPIADEPMPIIRRKREPIEIDIKPQPKRIKHPYAKKGLTKITKEKIYIYKVPKSEQKNAANLRFGFLTPNDLQNPDTGAYFVDFYDSSSNPALLVDYEWHFWKRLGVWGLKVGSGLGVANGHGQFRDQSLQGGLTPRENFTFVIFPNTVGAVWRMKFVNRQVIVPYAEGGGVGFGFGEFRDDDGGPKFGVALGAYFAVGGAFSLHIFDKMTMLELDRDYGINDVFLTAEYRYYQGFGNFDFTSDLINGGILFEF